MEGRKDGWKDGWMDGWMEGSQSRFKDCLQQSKIAPGTGANIEKKKLHYTRYFAINL